jgi:diguanylate cyclase (GGDEF)-like protein
MNDEAARPHKAANFSVASTQLTSALRHTIAAGEGVALINDELRVLAADAAVKNWLERAGHGSAADAAMLDALLVTANLPEMVHRALDAAQSVSFVALLKGADDADAQVLVTLRPLEGAGQRLALATIDPAPPQSTIAYDALTQLPDRREIARRVAEWRRASPDAPPRFAVLFLDLDDFKAVNDRFGHSAGDAVLQELAARWVRCVREGDLVSRYGGDEFIFLIRDVATPRDVAPVIERLQSATTAPVKVDGVEHTVHATIGAAVATADAPSIDELISAADRDMYAHKPRVLR